MKPKIFRTKPIKKKHRDKLNFSQEKVHGFNLDDYQKSKVLMVGAGGIGSNLGIGIVRKGIGILDILDGDDVEMQNLTRQLFHKNDLGKNKAICVAKHLSKQGFFETTINGIPYFFEEALELDYGLTGYDAFFCGIDNTPGRISMSKFALLHKIPVIFGAVSRDGNQLYCALQDPEKACFGCIFPKSVNDQTYPCNLPGIIDVLQIVAGYMNFALDTILCNRYREWNLIEIALSGVIQPRYQMIEKKNNCEICGDS